MKRFFPALWLMLLPLALFAQNTVHRIIIDGAINPIATEYIEKAIEQADDEGAELLIIEMDTPGGLMESMHRIVKAIQAADVPVAVYVAPSGSRAGSAGVFITYAAHIAAMAPSTNIGSAHPVFGMGSPGGEQPDSSSMDAMMEKVTNDAVAKIKTMAERRGRNVEWAEKAVRESANITESEALELNVIEYVAPTVDSLLSAVDGAVVELDDGTTKTLQTKNAQVITSEMSWRQRLLDAISDPNIAYILMMIGFYGILFELYNPGSILPGVAGGICLILGFMALHTLPVNYAGLALIIFAIILFILEVKIPSYGLLTIGGVIALIMGSVMLIDTPVPAFDISWKVIAGVVALSVFFFVFALGFAIKAQRSKPTTGHEGMVGEAGVVYKAINPVGIVQIHGEFWTARSDEKLKKGTRVKVIEYDGNNLEIKVKSSQ